MIVRSSILGMNFALLSVFISATVSLVVTMISPVFTHLIWKHQKRTDQQLAIAERFAVLRAKLLFVVSPRHEERINAEMEMKGMLFVIPVLFERKEVAKRALELIGLEDPVTVTMKQIELQAHMFAEAFDISLSKIPVIN